MIGKARIACAIGFLILSVLVDFTSKVMSVLADGALVSVAVVLLLPIIKAAFRNS